MINKRQGLFIAAIGLAAAALAGPAAAQVSVNIGQPGFYGRIDIGNAPAPQLVYPQPIIVQPPPRAVQRAPIYLRVPPEQARDWRRYCGRYQACGQPVYFVQDRWYRDVYAPRWRDGHGPRRDYRDDRRWHDDHDRGRHHGHDDRRYDRDRYDRR